MNRRKKDTVREILIAGLILWVIAYYFPPIVSISCLVLASTLTISALMISGIISTYERRQKRDGR